VNSKRGPLIAALVGVGLIVLVVAGLILPKGSAVRAKKQQVAQAQEQETSLVAQLSELKADAEKAGQAHRQIAKFQAEVPPTADLPGLIRLLNSTADRAGVDFMSVTPSQPALSVDSTYSTVPTQINMGGSYFALDQFLFRLENLSRIANVSSITVSPTSADGSQLTLTMSAVFYTTDLSAGPGSIPGATKSLPSTVVNPTPAGPTPTPSPSGA
jgi:Tfp pilus assembly protein PilO